jgi:hypothetical protein
VSRALRGAARRRDADVAARGRRSARRRLARGGAAAATATVRRPGIEPLLGDPAGRHAADGAHDDAPPAGS